MPTLNRSQSTSSYTFVLSLSLLLYLLFSACTPAEDFIEASPLSSSSWILAAEEMPYYGSETRFIPYDILTVSGDSITLTNDFFPARPVNVKELHGAMINHRHRFSIATAGDSIQEEIRFSQPTPDRLIVASYLNGELAEQIPFNRFEKPGPPEEKLKPLLSNSYYYEVDDSLRFLHFNKVDFSPDNAKVNKPRYVDSYELPKEPAVQNRSYKKGDQPFYMRMLFPKFTVTGIYPQLSFIDDIFNSRRIRRFILRNIESSGFDLLELEYGESTVRLRKTEGKIIPNPAAEKFSVNKVLNLLNEGEITFSTDLDFQDNTDVDYMAEEDFIARGIETKELQHFDFSFNDDGTYAFFVKDRSLESGFYRLSNDLRFLQLGKKKKEMTRLLPIVVTADGTIAFEYRFTVRTPKPLGEQLTSYFRLEVPIIVRARE